MNSIKTCITACKYSAFFVFDKIIYDPRFKLDSSNVHVLCRFIEVFSTIPLTSDSTKAISTDFIRYCLKFLDLNTNQEVSCSILKLLIDVLNKDFNLFFSEQDFIFSSLNLSQTNFHTCNLAARGMKYYFEITLFL
jgi:hypothetical protein